MTNERILISFQRSLISKTTSEYLCSKLDKDEDGEMIANITLLQTGLKKKLKAEAANALLFKLLCAILINDDLEESIISENDGIKENIKNSVTDTDNEHESEESENETTDDGDKTVLALGSKNSLPGTSSQGDSKRILRTNPDKKIVELTTNRVSKSNKPAHIQVPTLCKFFNHGRCNKCHGKVPELVKGC